MSTLRAVLHVLRTALRGTAIVWGVLAGIDFLYGPNPVSRFRDQLGWVVLTIVLIYGMLAIWELLGRGTNGKGTA
jgi:hypothetical protein